MNLHTLYFNAKIIFLIFTHLLETLQPKSLPYVASFLLTKVSDKKSINCDC